MTDQNKKIRLSLDLDGCVWGQPYCACGCGRETTVAQRTYSRKDGIRIIKGDHYRYIKNHHKIHKFRPQKAEFSPTVKPALQDIAWAAGFWEGEGSVVGHRHTYQVSLPQKDPHCLIKIRALFGGTVKQGKKINTWRVYGQHARDFLSVIFPYLSPRRREQVIKAGFGLHADKGVIS